MRVSHFSRLLLCAATLSVFTASAGITENFNSRKGIPIQKIRTSLQNSCWTFHHFDINNNGWDPKIEGDGAMVSGVNALQHGNSGIYTPMLNVSTQIEVSFYYKFNEDFSESSTRWMKICLANAANEIVTELETLHFIGVNATKNKKYSTAFKNITTGQYRLVLLYGGKGETASIAIDELNTSAPILYNGGCNTAPIAYRYKVTGMPDRSASGSLISNDMDKNSEGVTAFLIKGSPDGKVILNEDGTFTFAPNKNFNGRSTQFIYRVCDNGPASLCSPNTTVNINFPTGQLVDFKGSYKYDGNVELAWETNEGGNTEKFEVERSLDGQSWKNSGTVFTKNEMGENNDYSYIDRVGKNTALKKDLYYRLKQVENDGSVTTSRLMIVRVYNTKTVTMISVTPNPEKSDIAVNLQLQENSVVSLKIINSSGTTVLRKIADADKGTSNILIDGSSELIPGTYSLEVIVNSKERMIVKLLKE